MSYKISSRYIRPSLEFVVANTLVKLKKLEPNEIAFSQGFSQKVEHRIKKLICI